MGVQLWAGGGSGLPIASNALVRSWAVDYTCLPSLLVSGGISTVRQPCSFQSSSAALVAGCCCVSSSYPSPCWARDCVRTVLHCTALLVLALALVAACSARPRR